MTSTVKKTKPKKDPGRVAAGKRLAEFNRKARQGKRSENNAIVKGSPQSSLTQSKNGNPSFSLIQVISVVSIIVSLAGLYYKREEAQGYLKSVFLKQRESSESKPLNPEVATQPVSSIKSMD